MPDPGLGLVSADGFELVDQADGRVVDDGCASACCDGEPPSLCCGSIFIHPDFCGDPLTGFRQGARRGSRITASLGGYLYRVRAVARSVVRIEREPLFTCTPLEGPAPCMGTFTESTVGVIEEVVEQLGTAWAEGIATPGDPGALCVPPLCPVWRWTYTETVTITRVPDGSAGCQTMPETRATRREATGTGFRIPRLYGTAGAGNQADIPPVDLWPMPLPACLNGHLLLPVTGPLGTTTTNIPGGTRTTTRTLAREATAHRQFERVTEDFVEHLDATPPVSTVVGYACVNGQGTYRETRWRPAQDSVEYHREEQVTQELGWAINCDGSPEPGGEVPRPFDATICEAPPVRWVLGTPCGRGPGQGEPPPFALPAANVAACGVVPGVGTASRFCYRFDVNQPVFTTLPAGTEIGSAVIAPVQGSAGGGGVPSCCECQAALGICAATTITDRPQWLNAAFIGGVWTLLPRRASGRCCCKAGDRFRVLQATSTFESNFNAQGEAEVVEQFDMIIPEGPNAEPGLPSPMAPQGVPRNVGRAQYGLQLVVSVLGVPGSPDRNQVVDVTGPIGCEWLGMVGGISFDKPLHVVGMHPWGQDCPTARDVAGNGVGPTGWRVERYNVVPNCQLLDATGEWVRRDGSGAMQNRVRARVLWQVVEDPNVAGPCSGGCGGGVILGPTNGPLVLSEGGGGCAGCGGSDGRLR